MCHRLQVMARDAEGWHLYRFMVLTGLAMSKASIPRTWIGYLWISKIPPKFEEFFVEGCIAS